LTGSAVNEDGTFRLEKDDTIVVGNVNSLRFESVKRVSYKGKEISKGGMMGNWQQSLLLKHQ